MKICILRETNIPQKSNYILYSAWGGVKLAHDDSELYSGWFGWDMPWDAKIIGIHVYPSPSFTKGYHYYL